MRRASRAAMHSIVLVAFAIGVASGQATPPTRDTTSVTSSAAADPTLEARTSAVAAQLRCPVCQGLSIQDSPAELAQQMRSLVRDQLAAGKTPDQVKAYFISKYGEWILLAPKPSGFNLLAYLIPVVVVLGGGAAIVLAVRRWTTKTDGIPAD